MYQTCLRKIEITQEHLAILARVCIARAVAEFIAGVSRVRWAPSGDVDENPATNEPSELNSRRTHPARQTGIQKGKEDGREEGKPAILIQNLDIFR